MTDLRATLRASATNRRAGATFVVREREFQRFREALGFGLLNAAFAIEGASKALTPVHGDPAQGGPFATFAPGATPIGGTLRRSQHSAAYVDGQRIGGPAQDGNGRDVPRHAPVGAISAVVGTNVEYAVFVHDGSSRMAARPFLARAMAETADEVPALIAAGARRHMGGGTIAGAGSTQRSGRPRDSRGRFTSTR